MAKRILSTGDDQQLYAIRRDLSGGVNDSQHGSLINENQATSLINVDIDTPGESSKRPGTDLMENLGTDAGYGMFGFEPAGGTNELIAVHGTKLEGSASPGTVNFTEHKVNFTAGTKCTLIRAGEESENDVLLVKIDGNNWFRMLQNHTFQDLGSTTGTASDSPYNSNVALWFRQRLWILLNNMLYWSDVFPSDFATAFNTADAFRVDVGNGVSLVSIRDQGIIIMGDKAIYGVNPSTTPAATDKVDVILDIGCRATKSAIQVGDDILFLSSDGVRGLFRSQQDKLQTGSSYPISFPIKNEVDSLNWGSVSKATAVYFDNKYFLAVPVDGSSYNNEVWVYYPASQGWTIVQGWNVGDWGTCKINGNERLFYIDSTNGKVDEAWVGFDDNGTAIAYTEEGRKEDLQQPLITKCGGELRVKALASGNYDLSIYVSKDDEDYALMGTMNLASSSPVLPQVLPFTLADLKIIQQTFHLDSLGEWKQIRVKIVNNEVNTDDIIIYERNIITFANEYQSE